MIDRLIIDTVLQIGVIISEDVHPALYDLGGPTRRRLRHQQYHPPQCRRGGSGRHGSR